MSKFIEVKNDDYNSVIDLEKVKAFYIYCDSVDKIYSIAFKVDYDLTFRHQCKSELEAQMIYAKLKKILCIDEELNEIL